MEPAGRNPTSEWSARPWAARSIRALVFAGPLLVSVSLAWIVSSLAPAAGSFAMGVLRWVLIAALSTAVLLGVDRLARRLLPLAVLFGLTLAFPDQAPSRYQMALRNGSTAQLRRRIADARSGRLGDTPADAAEGVLQLVMALSVHDRLTRGHSERVRAYTQMIGEEMGLTATELDRLRWAGLLHDVGKLMVSADILNKPGRLTEDEFDIIKQHPEFGRRLVAPLTGWLGEAARAVWEHHERWDGRGYPRGISGLDISLAGRIVSVADAYDVMTSVRSYQKPVSSSAARAELARCSGTQFDPAVVRAFLNLSLGRLRVAMGPLSWLAQLPLFPTAVAAGATQGAATAATAFVGAAAASMGVGLSGTAVVPPSDPVEARTVTSVVALRDPIEIDTGTRSIVVNSVPPDVASGAGAAGVPTAEAGANATSSTTSTTSPAGADADDTEDDAVDAAVAPPALLAPSTTVTGTLSTDAADTTTTVPATTVVGTTVAPGTTSTTVAPSVTTPAPTTVVPPSPPTTGRPTPPPPTGAPTALYLDLPNRATLDASTTFELTTSFPTRNNALSFDPDRDGRAGVTIVRGTGAAWHWIAPSESHVSGAVTTTVYVAGKQVGPKGVQLSASLLVCAADGGCTTVAETLIGADVGTAAVAVTADLGTVDAVVPSGGTLRFALAVPADADDDVVLFASTRSTPSAVTITLA